MSELDCQALLARLQAFLDGELDAPSCSEVRTHLEDCGPCLQNAEFEGAFKRFVARTCHEDAPPGLLDKVKRLLD